MQIYIYMYIYVYTRKYVHTIYTHPQYIPIYLPLYRTTKRFSASWTLAAPGRLDNGAYQQLGAAPRLAKLPQ